VNAANWDTRAEAHMGPGGYQVSMLDDSAWLSSVVRFDRPRLGDVRGLDGLHLQCHLGTDTISLAFMGARAACPVPVVACGGRGIASTRAG
jgi:hypothetical protein